MRAWTLGVLAFGMWGCGGGSSVSPAPPPPPPPPPPPVGAVEVAAAATVLEAGGTLQVTATAKDNAGAPISGRTFTWNSSAPNVATVTDQGLVRGVAAGSTTVTASTGGQSAAVALTVRDTTSLPTSLSGRIDRLNLTLAAGRTYRVTGNLTLVADSNLIVAGTIELDPGATLLLFAGGTLDLTGPIGATPGASAMAAARPSSTAAPAGDIVLGGQRVNISSTVSGGGPIYVSGANTGATNFSLVTIGPRASIQPLDAENGTAATKNGAPGYGIEIGTSTARSRLGPLAPNAGPIRRLRILQSRVTAGKGGAGYNLRRADGAVANNIWSGTAGRGGDGGHVDLEVDELEVVGSTVAPGDGGQGGGAILINNDALLTGSGPAGDGESLLLDAGRGGSSGILTVVAGQVVAADKFEDGVVGRPASASIQGGNGKNGGGGGEFNIRMSERGLRGFVNAPGITVHPAPTPADGILTITDAANGGDATSPGRRGGAGGILVIRGSEPLSSPQVQMIELLSVGKGGRGFNGCLASPIVIGTDGGPGGSLQSGVAPVDPDPLDLSGGDGGNGWPTAGKGGAAGAQQGGAISGAVGLPGNLCPAVSVQPTQINIVTDRPVGQCQDNQLASGSVQLRNLVPATTQYSITVVNLQGTSGIGLFPNLASIGTGVGTVSGALPPNGTHVVWYKFYPCVARDGGGDAKAELQVILPGPSVVKVPIEVDMR